jgi:molybdate transport system substrate-binding protein
VARGEAELGVQLLCELVPVRGIDIVGPLPPQFQTLTHFSAGIAADAASPKPAMALLDLLHAGDARAAMIEGGIQPA